MTRRKLRLVPGPAGGKCYQCGGISGDHRDPCPEFYRGHKAYDLYLKFWKTGFHRGLSGLELDRIPAAYVLGWTRGRIEWALNQSAHERTPGLGSHGRARAAFAVGLLRCTCPNGYHRQIIGGYLDDEWVRCQGCGHPY